MEISNVNFIHLLDIIVLWRLQYQGGWFSYFCTPRTAFRACSERDFESSVKYLNGMFTWPEIADMDSEHVQIIRSGAVFLI